jgi:hypothetical protein
MRAWHIRRVFLNGASLYDHDQRHIYKAAIQALNRQPRRGIRQYNSERERQGGALPPKKVLKLSTQSINSVLTVNCCRRNCVQPFPHAKIHALRSQFFHECGQYFKSHRLLDVHRQIHLDAHGNKMITLEGVDVCPVAWYTIMEVSRATYYRWKINANNGLRAEHHGNAGTVKPRSHTLQATATLRLMLEQTADHMPHRMTTIETGEKVVSKCLPSSWRWKDSLPEINIVNAQFGLNKVSPSGLSRIRNKSFPEYSPKSRGDSFARCGQCDKFKKLRAASTRGSHAADIWTMKLGAHIDAQTSHRELYYANRRLSEKEPTTVLTIIHNKMDHSKTASPHFSHKNKATDPLMKLPVALTGMIVHGHGDVQYAHYGLDIYPSDSNHTVGSITKLLRDLESPPMYSTRQLFTGGGSFPLFQALLTGADMCEASLPPAIGDPVMAAPLPPVLNVQLDNACSDNKNRYVFSFFSLLVQKGVFREVYINFLLVGHTHEDIDAMFGRWSYRLRANDYPTLPMLMKSFMEAEKQPVIPHLIEEVPNFKAFVDGILCTGTDALERHTNAQQFKLYKDGNGWPMMQYKLFYTDSEWLPRENGGIRL